MHAWQGRAQRKFQKIRIAVLSLCSSAVPTGSPQLLILIIWVPTGGPPWGQDKPYEGEFSLSKTFNRDFVPNAWYQSFEKINWINKTLIWFIGKQKA